MDIIIDNLRLRKIWQDGVLIELEVIGTSSVINVISKVYTSDIMINMLSDVIKDFLDGKVDDIMWSNGEQGSFYPSFLSLRFIRKDKLGHILVEVFIDIDDGAEDGSHHCCFYVNTELGMLMTFHNKLHCIKSSAPLNSELYLNDF